MILKNHVSWNTIDLSFVYVTLIFFFFLTLPWLLLDVTFICSRQTLEMLEKKEKVLLKKAGQEVEKAKEYTRAKNKRGKHPKLFMAHIYNLKLVVCCGVI